MTKPPAALPEDDFACDLAGAHEALPSVTATVDADLVDMVFPGAIRHPAASN
jgi:hypothetical protein